MGLVVAERFVKSPTPVKLLLRGSFAGTLPTAMSLSSSASSESIVPS